MPEPRGSAPQVSGNDKARRHTGRRASPTGARLAVALRHAIHAVDGAVRLPQRLDHEAARGRLVRRREGAVARLAGDRPGVGPIRRQIAALARDGGEAVPEAGRAQIRGRGEGTVKLSLLGADGGPKVGNDRRIGDRIRLVQALATARTGSVWGGFVQSKLNVTVPLVLTIGGLLLAAALALSLLGTRTTVFMGTYRIDDLSLWATIILAPATALCALLAAPEVGGTDREGTVYSLLSFTALGALVLAGAGDTLFLVLGVLLSSLGSFALVAYPRDDRATEAAVKYLVFGSVASAAMIYGLTFWYGATGATTLDALDRLASAPLAGVGLLGVLIGLGYKAALAPFHFWAPDAYDGGPLAVAAFLSAVPKVGALFALAQVARSLPATPLDWRPVVAALAVIAMVWGNLAALPQDNVVRLLAYSSVAQSGYFLLGIVALGRSPLALQSLVVFAAAYAAMNLGAFAIVARAGRDLAALSGFGRSAPWAGAALVVFLLSLVGVPPLAGFGGKLLLFGAALDAGYGWLAVVAILNSVLSLAVYLRIIVPLYRSRQATTRESWRSIIIWLIALVVTVALGVGTQALVGRLP